jgi:DNA-binding CsgD family transcriptional regulator
LALLEQAERVARLGSWEWLPLTDELLWSSNLFRLFGLEPSGIVPTTDVVLGQTHPDDRERLATYVESIRSDASPPPVEYRVIQPGRPVRHYRSTVTRSDVGPRGVERIIGTLQDITEWRHAEREIAAHVAVSAVLSEWAGFDSDAERLVRELCAALEAVAGALWLPRGDTLTAQAVWGDPTLDLDAFRSATETLKLPRGVGLVGKVWERGCPIASEDIVAEEWYRRRTAAASNGLRGAIAFPVLYDTEVLAVLEFYYREDACSTPRLIQTVSAIGHEIGTFLARRRGQLEAPRLTPREIEVLALGSEGYAIREIAERLGVRPTTIGTHMEHIYAKLGVHDRAAGVAAGIRLGLIE